MPDFPSDVALKVIRPGMDSQQVIARFESERQALALMEHSNIAYVLDAGTSEAGARRRIWERTIPGRWLPNTHSGC